jgi:Domain of unknown function (DUF4388)
LPARIWRNCSTPEQAFSNPDQFVAAIRGLCAERRTGTLFVVTVDNEAARFVLRQGTIVAIQFRVRHGLDAIGRLRSVTSGRFNFTPDVAGAQDAPALPPTQEILAMLAAGAGASEAGPRSGASPAGRVHPAGRPAREAVSTPSGTHFERAQRVLEAELTEYLGPMAPLVCLEHLVRAGDLTGAGDLARLVEAIAKEIGDPAKEARFKREALAKLRE